MKRGAAVYLDSCTGCHAEEGVGEPRFFPPLSRNAVAQQNDPTGLLHIILAGDRTATTPTPALAADDAGVRLEARRPADGRRRHLPAQQLGQSRRRR